MSSTGSIKIMLFTAWKAYRQAKKGSCVAHIGFKMKFKIKVFFFFFFFFLPGNSLYPKF